MADHGLLTPGSHRALALTDDEEVLRCLIRAEVAWVQAQADLRLVPAAHAASVARVLERSPLEAGFDLAGIAQRAELGGNPVIAVLGDLRRAVREIDAEAVAAVHRGLTSQDVMDTALMLLLRGGLEQLGDSLSGAEAALAQLAERHRGTLAVARTLTQHALPTTFGLRCAQWLTALLEAHERLDALELPLAMGGAAGTLAGSCALFEGTDRDPVEGALALHEAWAARLGLSAPHRVWHTSRQPVLEAAAALGSTAAALGRIADDVLLLSRPELGELKEPTGPGRGVSSAMPQKQNPVLSVLLKRTALSAPPHVAALFAAAAASVDERPDGAWHAEWPAARELLRLSAIAASQLRELCEGLRVDPERMAANLRSSGPALLSERIAAALAPLVEDREGATGAQRIQRVLAGAGADADAAVEALTALVAESRSPAAAALGRAEIARLCDPRGYLGAAGRLIDDALQRLRRRAAPSGARPDRQVTPPDADPSPGPEADAAGARGPIGTEPPRRAGL